MKRTTKKDFSLLLLQNTFTKKEKVPRYEVPLLILKYLQYMFEVLLLLLLQTRL
ncbi:hypothetical protein DN390_09885 [Bacillus sp. SH7-1]|nr:hypothetical protein DN390_09885 [Bacillus sp. SH7-1]